MHGSNDSRAMHVITNPVPLCQGAGVHTAAQWLSGKLLYILNAGRVLQRYRCLRAGLIMVQLLVSVCDVLGGATANTT